MRVTAAVFVLGKASPLISFLRLRNTNMNIVTLIFGLLILGGAYYCFGLLLEALATGHWKYPLKFWVIFLGLLTLILSSFRFGNSYARESIPPDELVGTYGPQDFYQRLSKTENQETAETITLSKDGRVKATKIPAYLIVGDTDFSRGFPNSSVSFAGKWTVEKSSEVYVVRIEIQDFDLKESAGRSDYPRLMTLHIMRGSPRSLAFSVFDGSDFNDHVYERRDVQ